MFYSLKDFPTWLWPRLSGLGPQDIATLPGGVKVVYFRGGDYCIVAGNIEDIPQEAV